MKFAVVIGTRPEIIKMSPVIRELERIKADYFIVHSGQHYSYNMDRVFFEQLCLPGAKHNLEVGSGSHSGQTARILIEIEKVFLQEKPDIVLVQGDTNTVLAGAMAASKMQIEIGHIEAGLRSYDRHMPEEINRILTDHISDYLFVPTEKSKSILMNEGIAENKVFTTGNTIVDAVYQNLELANRQTSTIEKMGLRTGKYFLVTLHRQENVDNYARFSSILFSLNKLASIYHLPIIYPIHPRAQKRMDEYKLAADNLTLIEPVDYFSFLQLEKNARLILTDSGGVQEESCILGVPCLTLRDNTERPETVETGANMLAGTVPLHIIECSEIMLAKETDWQNPFGDGRTGARIVSLLTNSGKSQEDSQVLSANLSA